MTHSTILGIPYAEYQKKTLVRTAICIVLAAAVFAVNIALYCTVTKQTKAAFTAINIVLDIALAWWLLFYSVNVLSIRRRLLRLYQKGQEMPMAAEGKVLSIASRQKVYHFDCLTVELESAERTRKIFVIENSFESLLEAGKTVRFALADNVVVGCEVEDEK